MAQSSSTSQPVAPSPIATLGNYDNRLSECSPGMLFVAQRLRPAPYIPLSQSAVDDVFRSGIMYRAQQHVAIEALQGLYTALNGHCGINVADPKQIRLDHTQSRKSSASQAADDIATSAQPGSTTELDPMEIFRRKQIALNERSARAKGVCHQFQSRHGCSRGVSCQFAHVPKK
eukprot:GILI01054803.1.p1 GENE.GILI01054803.1~~GILI01054803.1.p1  ORF type:complete len:174 (+),score=24.04 GILI01054803.1:61-582(+)